jgi:hypothetical protein
VTGDRRERPEATPRSRAESRAAARARIAQQHTWVDLQVRQAMERGDFDDLPGAGKPIKDLGDSHDPNWWLKKLVERENVAVLPPSLALRKEDAELAATLDRLNVEGEVRRHVEDFNARVIHARYSTPQGPPLVTMPRDVEETVAAWKDRRAARRRALAASAAASPTPRGSRRRWPWRRR